MKVYEDSENNRIEKTNEYINIKIKRNNLTNINNDYKRALNIKSIKEEKELIEDLLEYYQKDYIDITEELLIQTLEDNINEQVEIFIYITAGLFVGENKEKSLLDLIKEKTIEKYKTW